MSRRLQVVVSDEQYKEVAAVARRAGRTIAEWVRDVLGAAARRAPRGGPERKLAAVRRAYRHAFPTADIDVMLADIETGYGRGGE
jgi:hypothetical protein